jgi:uncharacterized RDD family membrane protein YckC
MLIDTHDQPEPPPPRRPGREWPVRALVLILEAVILFVLSFAFPPFPAYILVMGACVLGGRGFAKLLPSTFGLKDHRQ